MSQLGRPELLPAHRDKIGTDEGQQTLATSAIIVAQQEVALVDAVDGPVVWHFAARQLSEGGKKSMIENMV